MVRNVVNNGSLNVRLLSVENEGFFFMQFHLISSFNRFKNVCGSSLR